MKWCAVCAVLLALAGCASRSLPPVAALVQPQGEYVAQLTAPAPLGTGDQTMMLTLTNARTHLPVGDANVSAAAVMLSPRLPAAQVSGRAQGNGVYQLPLRLPTATQYRVEVSVRRPGHADAQFTFPVTAGE